MKFKNLLIVVTQFFLLGVILWPNSIPLFWFVGTPFVFFGVALGLWTLSHNQVGNFNISPSLLKKCNFITTGPYRYVRHPMYTSVLLTSFGMAILWHEWFRYVSCLALLLLFVYKLGLEEKYMGERFPEYLKYKEGVSRLLPFIF